MKRLRYQETQTVTLLALLVVPLLLFLLGVIILQGLFGRPVGSRPAPTWLLVILFVTFSLLPLSFRHMTITVDGDFFTVGFGLVRKKIPLSQIVSFWPASFSWLTYGGWGIRLGLDGSMAYTAKGSRGIAIQTAKRKYVISTDNAEALYSILAGVRKAQN